MTKPAILPPDNKPAAPETVTLPKHLVVGIYEYLKRRPWDEVNIAVPQLERALRESE